MLSTVQLKRSFSLFLICLTVFPLLSCSEEQSSSQAIHEVESPYHHIRVIERADGTLRDMTIGRLVQATMQNNDPAHLVYPYSRSAFLALALVPEPQRVLFIGMGAGMMSNALRQLYPQLEIDLVELDQAVVKVAEDYFHFLPDDRTHIYVDDGRIFLRRTEQRYDLIFIDTFNAEGIPFHLMTREFLTLARSRLTDQGWLVSHYWGDTINRLFLANIRTHQEVFEHVYMLDAEATGDYIFLAPAQPAFITKTDILNRTKKLMAQKPPPFDLEAIAAREFNEPAAKVPEAIILTDDYAPVNMMRYQPAESR